MRSDFGVHAKPALRSSDRILHWKLNKQPFVCHSTWYRQNNSW